MKKHNHQNISPFQYKKIKINQQGYANPIDFSAQTEDIIVLAFQPGLGKTHMVLEYMKTQPNSFYFTDRHETIEENIKNWTNVQYQHWKGFSRRCTNKYLKSLQERYNLNPNVICSYCTQKCSYIWQFTKRHRVFAPYAYLSMGQVLNNLPEIIFLDEKKTSADKLTFNPQTTVTWLQTIQNHSTMPSIYVTHMQNSNYTFFLTTGFQNIQSTFYSDSMRNAFQAHNYTDLQIIAGINPYSLEKYFRLAQSYKDFTRPYYSPFYYDAFDILNRNQQENFKLVIMDASFNPRLFRYFLEAFNGEIGFNKTVSVKIFYSRVNNRDTHVYSMRLSDEYPSWFPKASFRNTRSMMKWFPNHLKKIREIYGEQNVGIITFQKIAQSGYSQLLGFNTQYYGGLRSSNTLKDKRVIVILGTYFESKNDVKELLKKLFDETDTRQIIEERETKEFVDQFLIQFGITTTRVPTTYDLILEPKKRRRYTDAKDYIFDNEWYLEGYTPPSQIQNQQDEYDMINKRMYPVEWIQRAIWDDEMYQAFHRSRGLLNNRIIFAYCWFPPEILEEFTVTAIRRDEHDEEQFWQNLEHQEKNNMLMRSFINDMDELVAKNKITLQNIQHAISLPSNRMGIVTTIAKKYGMYNKTDRDIIKQMMFYYYQLKTRVK